MVRLAVMGFMWDVSTPIALPLSAWLYNSGGYVTVMAVSLVLYVIACLLGLLRLWNFKEKNGGLRRNGRGREDGPHSGRAREGLR